MGADEADRKYYLDGVRGVAACVVFFGHLSGALTNRSWIFNGNSAVCIFFVLSGYVLSELVQRSSLSFPAQAVRRYLRLIVPILITSTFAWALLVLGAYRNQQAAPLLNTTWLGLWYNFEPSFGRMLLETFYGIFAAGRSDYNCNLWTMRPELLGSLYVFLTNVVAPSRPMRAFCYVAIALFYSDDYVLLFSVGALLHDFQADLAVVARSIHLKAVLFGTSLVLCAAPIKWFNFFPIRTADGMYWHMIAATLLVWSVLHWRLLQSLLGNALGRLLGRISFVLYLIHVPIICSLTSWLVLQLPDDVAVPLAAASTIIVVFAASIALHRWIDEIPTRWSRSAGHAIDALLSHYPMPESAK